MLLFHKLSSNFTRLYKSYSSPEQNWLSTALQLLLKNTCGNRTHQDLISHSWGKTELQIIDFKTTYIYTFIHTGYILGVLMHTTAWDRPINLMKTLKDRHTDWTTDEHEVCNSYLDLITCMYKTQVAWYMQFGERL